jgi:hypothetical protein
MGCTHQDLVLLDLASSHDVAVPRLRALTRMVHEAEAGTRPPGYANLDTLVAIDRGW